MGKIKLVFRPAFVTMTSFNLRPVLFFYDDSKGHRLPTISLDGDG